MIRNERQFATTKAQIDRFERELNTLVGSPVPSDPNDALFVEIQRDALRSQLDDLRAEAKDYEDLKSGRVVSLEYDSLDELPTALIAGRISAGLSQKGLAERIGVKEQIIQRYEANGYASTSFARIREVAHALNVEVREEVLLPSAGASVVTLFDRLEGAGLDTEFVKNRLLSPALVADIDAAPESRTLSDSELAIRAAASVGRVFGFDPSELFGHRHVNLGREAIGTARLKAPIGANQKRLAAYSLFAQYVAKLVLAASSATRQSPVPIDPAGCRNAILDLFGEINYESVLQYVWSLGIPVVPLDDPGAFHGALWRIEGRNVIVLKRRERSRSRWLVDLLHELRHAAQEPDQTEFGVIDEMESLRSWKVAEPEEEAVWFAIDVALDGKSEELAAEAAKRSGSSVEQLRSAVIRVADEHKVDVGVLADFMAFRLTRDGTANWWGAATNLQPGGDDPHAVSCDVLWSNINTSTLSRSEIELLQRAVSGW